MTSHQPDDVSRGRAEGRVVILGVGIDRAPGEVVLAKIGERVAQGRRTSVMFANAHTLNLSFRNAALRRALNESDFVLNDGSGVAFAARFQGTRFEENLNGSDFGIRILELAAATRWPVFLFGAMPGVAERAARNLQESLPGLAVVGVQDGYNRDDALIAERIKHSGAAVVFVALGNPLQELWLTRWLSESGAMLGVGVGAFLDFQSGDVRRANPLLNKLGIEWMYRLAREPRRLWRRYVLGNPLFIVRIVRARIWSAGRRQMGR